MAGGGQDLLVGNGGKDRLTGGDGKDTFVLGGGKYKNFHQKGAADYATITDFDTKLDTLQLDGSAANYVVGSAKGGLGIYAKTGKGSISWRSFPAYRPPASISANPPSSRSAPLLETSRLEHRRSAGFQPRGVFRAAFWQPARDAP